MKNDNCVKKSGKETAKLGESAGAKMAVHPSVDMDKGHAKVSIPQSDMAGSPKVIKRKNG